MHFEVRQLHVRQLRLTDPWLVAHTGDSARQDATGPRQGSNPTCFDHKFVV
jgi:hypothetical protein